jgi:endonuclease/exonuclease/phosphatase family metal-dependent hydrolase
MILEDYQQQELEMSPRSRYLSPRLQRFILRLSSVSHRSWIARWLHSAILVAEPAGRVSMRGVTRHMLRTDDRLLTVMSANLRHGWPDFTDLEDRLKEFARLVDVNHPDVVLLQEVARTPEMHVNEWLAQRLGMAYVYARANGHLVGIGFEEGLAIFSRHPLSDPRLVELGKSASPFVRRLALSARVKSHLGEFLAFSTHLGLLPCSNAHQAVHLDHWVAGQAGDTPAVIGGDFNSTECSSQIRRLKTKWMDAFRHLHPNADAFTHAIRWPWGNMLRRARLDYIFLRPGRLSWRVVEALHLQSDSLPFSDHHAVLVRFSLDL